MSLEIQYANGQLAALMRYKVGESFSAIPTVRNSTVGGGRSPGQTAVQPTTTTPQDVKNRFDGHVQGLSTTAANVKLSPPKLSAEICTTCRKARHYGHCARPRSIPEKSADFNAGMTADDVGQGEGPSTSPHYHSATSSSALARSPDGRPADEQAASNFADLYRHLGISNAADEPGRMYGGLNKVSSRRKLADFMLPGSEGHSMHEQRGPSVNPYEERRTRMSPPAGWGDEGPQRTERAFDQIDGAVDTTNIGGGFGEPDPGPAALG